MDLIHLIFLLQIKLVVVIEETLIKLLYWENYFYQISFSLFLKYTINAFELTTNTDHVNKGSQAYVLRTHFIPGHYTPITFNPLLSFDTHRHPSLQIWFQKFKMENCRFWMATIISGYFTEYNWESVNFRFDIQHSITIQKCIIERLIDTTPSDTAAMSRYKKQNATQTKIDTLNFA